MTVEGANPHPEQDRTIHIIIDRKKYAVIAPKVMTGLELRKLADPDIGQDRDLFLDITGPNDKKIEDNEKVKLEDGMTFYSAPRSINPGS